MNQFGKICVVFVTASSLAFVAFAAAMRNGGRNWPAEAEEIRAEFVMNVTPYDPATGAKAKYAMTHRRSGAPVGTSEVLAEVVVKSRQKQISVANEEITKLTTETEAMKKDAEAAVAASAADEIGLQEREKLVMAQLDDMSQKLVDINTQIVDATNQAQKIRSVGQERREEGYRLKNQLELLRNDLFAAQVQRKNLEEEELRLKEIRARLERRRQQLSSSAD